MKNAKNTEKKIELDLEIKQPSSATLSDFITVECKSTGIIVHARSRSKAMAFFFEALAQKIKAGEVEI